MKIYILILFESMKFLQILYLVLTKARLATVSKVSSFSVPTGALRSHTLPFRHIHSETDIHTPYAHIHSQPSQQGTAGVHLQIEFQSRAKQGYSPFHGYR